MRSIVFTTRRQSVVYFNNCLLGGRGITIYMQDRRIAMHERKYCERRAVSGDIPIGIFCVSGMMCRVTFKTEGRERI